MSHRYLAAVALFALAACAAAPPPPPPPPPRSAPCLAQPLPAPKASALPPSQPLPPLPPLRPQHEGDAFTVFGAYHALHTPGLRPSVEGKQVTVIGYIVATNLDAAPDCAVHRPGKADPPGCTAPMPELSLAGTPDGAGPIIKVMGFAANFAQLVGARDHDERAAPGERYADSFYGVPVPRPLPAKGARIKIRGTLSTVFTRASSGVASWPDGIVTYEDSSYLVPPPEPARLGSGAVSKPRPTRR